jgi:hypothetical protein
MEGTKAQYLAAKVRQLYAHMPRSLFLCFMEGTKAQYLAAKVRQM